MDFDIIAMGERPAGIVVTYDGAAAAFIAEGPCPRCQHDTSREYALTALTADAAGGRAIEGETDELVTMRCSCTAAHAGRPDDDDGCGAYWKVDLS